MVTLGAGGMRPVIRTFTASGKALGSVMWAGAGILEWGWSDELELVVVDTSGMVSKPYPCVFCSNVPARFTTFVDCLTACADKPLCRGDQQLPSLTQKLWR